MTATTPDVTGVDDTPWVPALVANDDAAFWQLGPYACEIQGGLWPSTPRFTLKVLDIACRDLQRAFFEDRLTVPWLPFLRYDRPTATIRYVLLSAKGHQGVKVEADCGPQPDGFYHIDACDIGASHWTWSRLPGKPDAPPHMDTGLEQQILADAGYLPGLTP